jgi:hypothetical protein
LQPLTTDARDRLREVWISAATYDVLAARTAGNFTDAPATTIPWLIRFEKIDGATYISREVAEAVQPHRPVPFDAVTLTFEHIAPRYGSPDLMFAIDHDLEARGHVYEPNESGGRGQPAHSC